MAKKKAAPKKKRDRNKEEEESSSKVGRPTTQQILDMEDANIRADAEKRKAKARKKKKESLKNPAKAKGNKINMPAPKKATPQRIKTDKYGTYK
ncbi:hypothetical protein KAT92_00430 [Candidatus Babeliales bacterium]|nr:hypothetical protein [Candidatus Babeliales bacterium]